MIRICRAAILVLLLAVTATGSVAATGPFSGFAGTWSGNGNVDVANGARERLRCRAHYEVASEGSNLRLKLQCASESYKFTLTGEAAARGDGIKGVWSESSRNVAGVLEGRIDGDRIEAVARGAAFAVNISLSTRGKRQSVMIAPLGGTQIAAVNVTLNRQ